MRIGLDCRYAVREKARGIGRYIQSITRALTDEFREDEFIFYVDQPDVHASLPIGSNIQIRVIQPAIFPLWEQILLPRQCNLDSLNVLHLTSSTGPIWGPRSVPKIVTVHDVAFCLPPEKIPPPKRAYQRMGWWYRKRVVPRLAHTSNLILAVSEYTRQEIIHYLNVEPSKVHVAHHGVGEEYFSPNPLSANTFDSRADYEGASIVLFAGESPHKNTQRAIEAFSQFKLKTGLPRQVKLMVLGASAEYGATLRCEQDSQVQWLGHVQDKRELAKILNESIFTVNVSLNESFGLPCIEAMAAGSPLIAAVTAAIPEVVGDAAVFVDPYSVEEISAAMECLWSDGNLRQRMIGLGHIRARQFSWAQCAKTVHTFYEECARKCQKAA